MFTAFRLILIASICLFSPALVRTRTARAGERDAGIAAPAPLPAAPSFIPRHVTFEVMDGLLQYRYIDNGAHQVADRDLLYKLSTRVKISLWGEGKTYVALRGESGRSFQGSTDYTGVGKNKSRWTYNLKSLYAGQKIGSHLEAQAGGIEYDRGAGAEGTYADNDGWLEGYRLRYSASGHRWAPDKVSVTVGYVGDLAQPNEFARIHRMGDENYIQVLVQKQILKNGNASAEFFSLQGIRYGRSAVRWKNVHAYLFDEIGVEQVVRATDHGSFGWFGTLSRKLDQKGRFVPGFFYSQVPSQMYLNGKTQMWVNGDCFVLGKRTGPTFKYTPFKQIEFTLFGSDRLDNTPGPRYRGQIQVRYQFASLFNQALR